MTIYGGGRPGGGGGGEGRAFVEVALAPAFRFRKMSCGKLFIGGGGGALAVCVTAGRAAFTNFA